MVAAVEGGGLPPRLPRRLRLAFWSAGTGMTVRIPRCRRCARTAREEYALSARNTSGRVRGRPRERGTRKRAITSGKAGAPLNTATRLGSSPRRTSGATTSRTWTVAGLCDWLRAERGVEV
jgi:hypothetical protein